MDTFDKQKTIDNFRSAMGTLPSRQNEKTYDYVNALEVCHVELRDWPKNPYKNIVNMVTSTWGSGKTGSSEGSCKKWEKLTPENRYRVVLSTLQGQTLPAPLESLQYVFEFNGIPRHTFDQFARWRVGCAIASIGCRDNNKLDAPFVLYPDLYKAIMSDINLRAEFEVWTVLTKNLYEKIVKTGGQSWQEARAVLPMSYNHSWTATVNYLALKGQCARRLMACEEAPIVLIFWKMRAEVKKYAPLLANYLRPQCDGARKCVYEGEQTGMTKYFSALFKGCGRWPSTLEYAEFNRSCTSYEELSKYVEIVGATEWLNLGEDDYEKLSEIDKMLFEEN